MKSSLLALLMMAGASQAAITISGSAVTNARDFAGTTPVAAGATALLIVDTGNNGFIGLGNLATNTTLTAANDPGLTAAQAGMTLGSTFGGDLVLNVITTTSAGVVGGLLTNVSIADYTGMNFAVVWLAGDGHYGIVRGTDWTFPAGDSGSFTMSSTDLNGPSSYYQVNVQTPAANAPAFRTTSGGNSAAAFTIIPEPSVALLGALGLLGLVRRRR
ncbi:MAG TPA: hypothetical protein VGE67_06550 [Haloferula sp.]